MVTIAEALEETEQAKLQLLQRKREIKTAEQRARNIRVRGTVAEQLRAGTPQELTRRRKEAIKVRKESLGRIEEARAQASAFEKQIVSREKEIESVIESVRAEQQAASSFNSDLIIAKRLAAKGARGLVLASAESKRIQRLTRQIAAGERVKRKFISQRAELQELGLKPIFVEGELTGFRGEQSIPLELLPIARPEAIPRLKEIGFITVEREKRELQPLGLSVSTIQLEGIIGKALDVQPAPSKFETFVTRFVTETRATPSQLIFGRAPVTPALALTTIAAQDISKTLETPGAGRQLFGPAATGISSFLPGGFKREQRMSEFRTGFISAAIPKTPESIVITTAFPSFISAVPTQVARPILAGVGGLQVIEAFQPGLSIEERAVAGVSGVSGIGASAFIPSKFQIGKRQLISQAEILGQRGILSPEATKATVGLIKQLKFFRGQPDVPITKQITEILPKGLTQLEREAFIRPLLVEKIEVFGGQVEALRGIRETKDIDIAAKENLRILREFSSQLREVSSKEVFRSREAVGLGEEKAFDIKPLERLREFPLTQRAVKTIEGVEVTRLSEQLSRSLAGFLELRKGGKDIGSAILDARSFLSQASSRLQQTKFPFLKPIRQFKLARAERRLAAFETLTLPEAGSLVAGFARTKKGEGVKIVDLPKQFKPTTKFPGFQEFAVEFGKLFPAGKRAQIGGTRPSKPDFKINGIGRSRVIKQSDLSVGFKKPPRISPSTSKPFLGLAPSSFFAVGVKPSGFTPLKFPRRPTPSIFEPPPTERIGPGVIIKPTPSEFGEPPPPRGFPGLGPGPTISPFVPIDFFTEEVISRRRRKGERRQPKRKKILPSKRFIGSIAPSFTAVTIDLRGKFPTPKIKGLGLLPTQLRVIPKRKSKR